MYYFQVKNQWIIAANEAELAIIVGEKCEILKKIPYSHFYLMDIKTGVGQRQKEGEDYIRSCSKQLHP